MSLDTRITAVEGLLQETLKKADELADQLRDLKRIQRKHEALAVFVQVSVLGPRRLYPSQWDSIDGTRGKLRVGDRVLFSPVYDNAIPSDRPDGKIEGVVRALGRNQLSYAGPWSTVYPI